MKLSGLRLPSLLGAVALVLHLAPSGFAAAGDEFWDAQFGVPGADGGVADTLVVGDQLYVAGGFASIGGVAANQVARWDGTNWYALGSGVNGGVYALAADERYLYVAGVLYSAGGKSGQQHRPMGRDKLVRLGQRSG